MASIRHILLCVFILWLTVSKELMSEVCPTPKYGVLCPERWLASSWGTTCVKLFYALADWDQARNLCREHGADLIHDLTYDKIKFLKKLTKEARKDTDFAWVTYRKVNEMEWSWTDKPENHRFTITWVPGNLIFMSGKCAVMPSAALYTKPREILLKRAVCDTEYAGFCTLKASWEFPVCPSGQSWSVLMLNDWHCVREIGMVTWREGRNICSRWGGTLFNLVTPFGGMALPHFLERGNAPWIGLRLNKTLRGYYWVSGKYMYEGDWDFREDGDCIYLRNGKYAAQECEKDRSFVCEKKRRGRPGPIMEMSIRWHVDPETVFFNLVWEATCTAKGAEAGRITWVASDIEGHPLSLKTQTTHQIEANYTLGPECVNVTTSTLKVIVEDYNIHDMNLTCFSYEPIGNLNCTPGYPENEALCMKSEVIHLERFINRPPTLQWDYNGARDGVTNGDIITANCSIMKGEGAMLLWVVYFADVPHVVTMNDTKPGVIVTDEVTSTYSGPFESSTLQFSAMTSMSNMSIACFSYDARKFGSLECLKSNMLCARTETIPVSYVTNEVVVSWYSFPHMGFFVGALAAAAVLAVLSKSIIRVGEPDEGFDHDIADFASSIVGTIISTPID